MAYTIVLIVADTSTEPVVHLAAKVEAQKNQQRGNQRNEYCYDKSGFIHGISVSQQPGCQRHSHNTV